jgi:hypothetical protein
MPFSTHKFEHRSLCHNLCKKTSFGLILSTESSFIGFKFCFDANTIILELAGIVSFIGLAPG